jgi:4-amino-4-deoxy-L-arabinose transferase-like glycosyltransferase
LVFEHFERFLTPAASRPGPWHYFIWITIAGLIPWTGFLWPAVRDAVQGGPQGGLREIWLRRKDHAEAWFFVVWAAFVLFFFSVSKSKLPPYILPIFPALALLIGAWLARVVETNAVAGLRSGFRVYPFINGLLAVALATAVLRPGLIIHDFDQAAALRLPALGMMAVLVIGGVLAPWLARVYGARAGLQGVVAAATVFFVLLQLAAPDINKPGTKPLALQVRAKARAGDRVLHYHEFFHDFTFYAARLVDVVAFKGELELEEDAAARASGRFMDEAAFRALWAQPGRVFAVARRRDVDRELFRDRTFRYHLLGQTEDHYLFSNQP